MQGKKIISVAIAGVLVASTFLSSSNTCFNPKALTANAISTYDSWQEAYWDTLLDFTYGSAYSSKADNGENMCSTYAIHDMNGDGVPELFINYQPITASASVLYTFYDSKVVKLMILPRAGFVSYCEDDGLIESSGGGGAGGYVYTTYSKIIDGELVDVDSFMISASTVPSTYSRNGATITEAEYNTAMKQYQSKTWSRIGRENYFDDILVFKGDIYYRNFFDHYSAWFVSTDSTAKSFSISDRINNLPVTEISGNFIAEDSVLETITIPSTIDSFYYSAFKNGKKLSAINVASSNQRFSSKGGVMYSKDMTEVVKFPTAKDASSYVFPDSVSSIGRYAFAWCNGPDSAKLNPPSTIQNSVNMVK